MPCPRPHTGAHMNVIVWLFVLKGHCVILICERWMLALVSKLENSVIHRCKSAATISAQISRAVISGTQPSFSRALVASPSSVSTSAGRK